MQSLKGIFKSKSKSDILSDNSLSDAEGKDGNNKSELQKSSSKKSNNSLLKLSNVELENEPTEILRNEVDEMSKINNDPQPNTPSVIGDNKSTKDLDNTSTNNEIPAIKNIKDITSSLSMTMISPTQKNPYASDDQASNITDMTNTTSKSKKELKKEMREEEKKKKKQLKIQKKKEKREKKRQKNLIKGEFYALNPDKKKSKIKKEYRKLKKQNKNGNILDSDAFSVSSSPISPGNKSPKSIDPKSPESKSINSNIPKIEIIPDTTSTTTKAPTTTNNNNDNTNKENSEEPVITVDYPIFSLLDNHELLPGNDNNENNNNNNNNNNVKKEHKKKKGDKNEKKLEELEDDVPLGILEEKEKKEKKEKKKEVKKEKDKASHIEEIEDDLPLAILRYKNPQPEEDEEENRPLSMIKPKFGGAGNGMRKSVSASDLLIRVRQSMALRNSGYFGSSSNSSINSSINGSHTSLQPIKDDEEDDMSLAAVKEKRESMINPNNLHPYTRNVYKKGGLRTSLSSSCLDAMSIHSYQSNNILPGFLNEIAPNGIPINGMPRNGIPMNSPPQGSINSAMLMNRNRAESVSSRYSILTTNTGLKGSRSSLNISEFNKIEKENEIQRKRQSIIESNKRRSQIMMNNYTKPRSNSIDVPESVAGSIRKGSVENTNSKLPNNGKRMSMCETTRFENEIQEYPGQKFVTFTPMEYNTFPATASVRVIPGQSKMEKIKRRSLAVEVQTPKESLIPIETKENNFMQIENLRYKQQKKKEHQEYENKITSWINNSASTQAKK